VFQHRTLPVDCGYFFGAYGFFVAQALLPVRFSISLVDRRPGVPNRPAFGLLGWRCPRLRTINLLCGTGTLACAFFFTDCWLSADCFLCRVFLPFWIFGRIFRTFVMSSSLQQPNTNAANTRERRHRDLLQPDELVQRGPGNAEFLSRFSCLNIRTFKKLKLP